MAMQVKLLRVLQDGSFTPVGGNQMRRANVRVLAATNRDLTKMVKDGTFREDLYYRLNVINVTVPALRDRSEDIKLLSDHFLAAYAKESKKPVKTLSAKCFEKMMNFSWPGNVRQLENEVERLCVLSGDDLEVSEEFLSQPVLESGKKAGGNFNITGKLRDAMEELEKQMILDGLSKHRFNRSKVAKELGMSRAGLIMKIEKYGLDKRTGT